MAHYLFVTTWKIDTDIENVWRLINEPEVWPTWWPAVESTRQLSPGGEDGIGSRWQFVFVSRLPYKLAFESQITHKEAPFILEGQASGELEGFGRWELSQEGSLTTTRYTWNVNTTKTWMNVLTPLLRPLFSWNHNVTMQACSEGMARYLGVSLASPASHGPTER
ncbi:MAG: SRPBCC family protein [Chloroflexi bacterium]|nr:SRPBCC family protein [Chloroflexota bacterium]